MFHQHSAVESRSYEFAVKHQHSSVLDTWKLCLQCSSKRPLIGIVNLSSS